MTEQAQGVNPRPSARSSVYFPVPPDDPEALEAKHGVANEIRALAELCVIVDACASGVQPLAGIAELLAEVKSRLEALPRLDLADATTETSLAERSPFVGRSNPLAAPLHLEKDGAVTRGWAVYGQAYAGRVGDMHGGAVIGAFDDLLGCAQMVGPVTGRTATLTVRFRAANPTGRRIDYEARLDRVEGRKVFCSGAARCEGRLLAEAEAVFVAAPNPDSAGTEVTS